MIINWESVEVLEKDIAAEVWKPTKLNEKPDQFCFTEDEAFDFLADCFAEDTITVVDDEMLGYLPEQQDKTITGKDGLRKDIWDLIDQSMKESTKKKYTKYQQMYVDYWKKTNQDPLSEATYCHFFKDSIDNKLFGLGSVWSVYSCINHWAAKKFSENLNDFKRLRALLKALTKWYLPKKAGIIKAEDMDRLLRTLNHDDPYELQTLVWAALSYYGLLRKDEVTCVEVQDVHIDEEKDEIWTEFDRATKTRAEGFSFCLPGFLIPAFQEYIRQLGPNPDKKSRFLKNMRSKDGIRKENQGKNQERRIRFIERFLGYEEGSLTSHSFRRSGATQLANSGISLINLKKAGRWRSSTVAEGYIERSRARMLDQMKRLTTSVRREESKVEVSNYNKYI